MLKDAMDFALGSVDFPQGKWLWLYGEAKKQGDIYSPFYACGPAVSQNRHISIMEDLDDSYDAVAVSLPRQREEAQGMLALAFGKSRKLVIASAANDEGGKRLVHYMERYGVALRHISKHHQRVVWTLEAQAADRDRVREDLAHLSARQVSMEGESWWSVPGLFAWDRIDPASRLLIEHLPGDLAGIAADFGCGYGYLSAMLARRHAALTRIDAYDYDRRALECCARNAGDKVHTHWEDVAALSARPLYDAVVMNPPFHTGKAQNTALGQLFIVKAWERLKPGGRLFLVANRNLPYERTVEGLRELYAGQGYKILTGRKP